MPRKDQNEYMKPGTAHHLLFFITVCLSAMYAIDTTAYRHEEREFTALEKETFDSLRKTYSGELLDAKLKTLNTLATSAEYLNFLAKTYPKFAPFLDIHDFDKRVMPPKDRYLKFCQEYLNIPSAEEITDDEQYVIHHIATSSWASEASQRGKDRSPSLQPGKPFRLGHVLAFKPIGRKILEQREGKRAAFAFVLLTAQEHLDEDVRWIKALFEKHGRSEALLRIAVQDPMLFYRIFYAFSTDTTFLKCVYDPIDLDAERRKQLDKKYEQRSRTRKD